MKTKRTQRLQIVLGLSLLVAAGVAAPLLAQSTETIVVKIPFEFVVGDRTLPAGEYIVQHAAPHTAQNRGMIQIQSEKVQGPYVLTMSMSVVRQRVRGDAGKLTFHRYGDTYFLSQVWWAGTIDGQQLFKSRVERELAQANARPQVASITAQAR